MPVLPDGSVRHSTSPWAVALPAGLVVCVVLWLTAPYIPIVWDEGDYLGRAERIARWFRALIDPTAAGGGLHALSSAAIKKDWWFVTDVGGHPVWFAVPS